jgi:hypothetical protein
MPIHLNVTLVSLRSRRAMINRAGILNAQLPGHLEILSNQQELVNIRGDPFSLLRGLLIINPVGHGRITESHFAGIVAFIPFRVAVSEQDVLSQAVDLPDFKRRAIVRSANAILCVIILVRIQRIKRIERARGSLNARRVAAQDISRGKRNGRAIDAGIMLLTYN